MSDTLKAMATGETVARDAHALSIVIPAKDEEESLPLVVARIIAACRAGGHTLRDIVLVDDGSSDNTWEVMSKLAGAERGDPGDPAAAQFWQGDGLDGRHRRLPRRSDHHYGRRSAG